MKIEKHHLIDTIIGLLIEQFEDSGIEVTKDDNGILITIDENRFDIKIQKVKNE